MPGPCRQPSRPRFGLFRRGLALAGIGCWLVLGAVQAVDAAGGAVTVTVTQRAPIETLSASGDVSGVTEATVGTHYTLVSSDGQQVVLQDAQGARYRIPLAATDYTPAPAPAPATPPPAATNAAPPVVNNAPTPAPSAPTDAATTPAAAPPLDNPDNAAPLSVPVSDDTVAAINKSLGKDLFSTQVLWKESALLVANRIGLGLEDKTKWETAYRRYFYDRDGMYAPAAMLGGQAYCVALYADANDTPTSVLIAFTNDGDYKSIDTLYGKIFELQHPTGAPDPNAGEKIGELQQQIAALKQTFEPDREAEAKTLEDNLTTLFGEPHHATFGSDATTREDAKRWDWNGVSFLLTCEENEYNLLRIVPTELADVHGRSERIPRTELGPKLEDAVEHRPNGDVIITQLPMADQGLKGYCVPATWERVLRYTGVPGDMYTLSRIGGAGFGGGERGADIASQLDETLHDYGRHAEGVRVDQLDYLAVRRYIDKRVPIFWSVNPGGYKPAEDRYALCDRDTDWDEWMQLLGQARATPHNKLPAPEYEGGHQVLIIGYNPDTKEIAWSDPWGRNTRERWMTQEEAQRCSLGEYYIITW